VQGTALPFNNKCTSRHPNKSGNLEMGSHKNPPHANWGEPEGKGCNYTIVEKTIVEQAIVEKSIVEKTIVINIGY